MSKVPEPSGRGRAGNSTGSRNTVVRWGVMFLYLLVVACGALLVYYFFADMTRRDFVLTIMGWSLLVLIGSFLERNLGEILSIIALFALYLVARWLLMTPTTFVGLGFVMCGYGLIMTCMVFKHGPKSRWQIDEKNFVRKSTRWIAAAVFAGFAIAWIVIDVDPEPNSQVAEVLLVPLNVRARAGALCAAEGSSPDVRSLRAIIARERAPQAAQRYEIKSTPAGTVRLEFELKEVLWEAISRYHSVAIPAGAKIVFEGRCAGANRFEWSLHRDTTVPATLLPELGGEFAPGK